MLNGDPPIERGTGGQISIIDGKHHHRIGDLVRGNLLVQRQDGRPDREKFDHVRLPTVETKPKTLAVSIRQ
jgi:hypothetical protein